MQTGTPIALLFALVRLFSIFVQERKYTFPGRPEMSDKLRYEWRLYLHPIHHTHRFFVHHIFSLEQQLKRENYTHNIHVPGGPEMSDKSIYESQIILRYYTHIIHELSLE